MYILCGLAEITSPFKNNLKQGGRQDRQPDWTKTGKGEISDGQYMAHIRPIYGLYTAYIWPIYGLYMAYTRPIAGLYTAYSRHIYGL